MKSIYCSQCACPLSRRQTNEPAHKSARIMLSQGAHDYMMSRGCAQQDFGALLIQIIKANL
jgi:hypothetical protein